MYIGFFEISGLAAKLGGICSRQYNVAIVTDSGVYSNTLIAIHELGHLWVFYCRKPRYTLFRE